MKMNNINSQIYNIDSRKISEVLPKELLIQTTISSPPYYNMKDYGVVDQVGYGQSYHWGLAPLIWGCEQGFKTFHLGGGVGSGEDNLYKFKAAFNRNSDYQFSIGKEIFYREKYDELVRIRKNSDESFNAESSFFPLYRA